MNPIPESVLEVCGHHEPGYKPVIDYRSWRVALLNFTTELLPEKISQMQKHSETDEVFVLLAGRCILFLGEGTDAVTQLYAADMQPFQLYNVKCGAWHSHTLSRDAKVVIVENRDTTVQNSPIVELTPAQRQWLVDMTRQLWK